MQTAGKARCFTRQLLIPVERTLGICLHYLDTLGMFRLRAADAVESKLSFRRSVDVTGMELQRREMFLPGNRSKTVLPGTPADSAMVLLFCSPNSPAGWPVVHRQIRRSASTWGHVESAGNGV